MLRKIAHLHILGMFFWLTIAALTGSSAVAQSRSDRSCSIDRNPARLGQTFVVNALGLPTNTAMNLLITDPNGDTQASPIGSTPDGTLNLNESPSLPGITTYTFSGSFKKKTTIYASCSVLVL